MFIKRLVPLIILSILIMLSLHVGCDKLITEQNYITTAGHPIANFDLDTGSIDTGCAPHTVGFVDLSDGPRDQYLWFFGDGDSSTDTNPIHTYDTAGLYTVSLTINNTATGGTDTEVKKRYIYIGATNAAFDIIGDSTCFGNEVTFVPQILTPLRTYNWDFGDTITSTDSTPTHVFDSAGFYWVHLIVNDYCGTKEDSSLVTVAECPTVVIKADTTIGCAPFTVVFQDSSYTGDNTTLDGTSRIWYFGTGTSVTEVPVDTITYDTAGVYTVKLSIKSNDGSTYLGGITIDSIIDMITVYDEPNAEIGVLSDTISCKSQYQPFRVNFENLTTGHYDSLLWIFGDDDSSTAESPIHEYQTPGEYTVKLIAYSELCGTDSTQNVNFVKLYDILYDSTTYFSTRFDSLSTDLTLAYYTFVDTSKGIIVGWDWDFGDTSTVAPSDSIEHALNVDSIYTITLTIENGCNTISVDTTITAGQ